jgi:glycosyltransferase involved in cell wall biosynthesis
MHVLNVNFSIDFETGGGMAERTFQMSRALAQVGVRCTVLTINTGHNLEREEALSPADIVAMPLLWRRFYVPLISWREIKRLVESADVVHLMGHWTLLNAVVYLAVRRARKPYVVCPAGSLPLFGRSAWLKKIYNLIIGNAIVRNASAWIAVTEVELPHFEAYGVHNHKVTVIANGVCEEDFPSVDIEIFRLRCGLPKVPIILFMGRLNPIKGPDLLLSAFSNVQGRIPDHHLVFAGPDEGMQACLVAYAARNGLAESVHFLGFLGGMNKAAAYQMASLLVVPSRQEAMSIVALEAGVCGTPVMLTDQCGFGEVRSLSPRLEVQATVDGISEGLINLLNQPDQLGQMAIEFRELVLKKYTWTGMVEEYLDLYSKIQAGVKAT